MKLTPVNNQVITTIATEKEEKTKSGIIIPETSKTSRDLVVVEIVSIGEECKTPLKPGQRVVTHHYSGHPIQFEGKQYRIMAEKEILAKYEEEK